MSDTRAGGCLCGRIRYRFEARLDDVAHCHCRICQRSTGTGFVTWGTIPRAALEITGDPGWYRSSAKARRGFCPACGTQLFFDADGEATIDVTIASLDASDDVLAHSNIWIGSRRSWIRGFDRDLPDHEGETASPVLSKGHPAG